MNVFLTQIYICESVSNCDKKIKREWSHTQFKTCFIYSFDIIISLFL